MITFRYWQFRACDMKVILSFIRDDIYRNASDLNQS